jgi:alpha-glucosidase (family GH31 glycosyl hydrolase)
MHRLFLCFLAAGAAHAATGAFVECSAGPVDARSATLRCKDGAQIRLEPVTADMLRVRTSVDGTFPESLTVRWGFVRDTWPAVPFTTRKTADALYLETAGLRIKASLSPFELTVSDRSGHVLLESSTAITPTALAVRMATDEHFYGLGFQRAALDVRGHKLQWWRAFRSGEATVPFFMSTRGYGFYSNNTYRHVFDFTAPDAYSVTADGGRQDFYILCAPSFRKILDQYTELTGKPMLAPRWALGIGYEARYMEEQPGVMKVAEGFRKYDIPLDWIGLEPGWEDVPYRMKWNWSPTRFPNPEGMIRTLAGMGIKMGLWESGEAPKTGYSDEKVRQAWYAPRIDGAIRKGIKFFKQDDPYPRMISSQEWLEPEFNSALGGSGHFTAAEMNNTSNSLYSDTAMKEYRRITGERTMIMFNGYNSSIASHRWPFTWEADFPLGTGALSASLSAHSLVSTRDRNEAPDGIHLGYLAPLSYLEAWAYYKEPWFYSEPLLEMNRFYVKLRYRLVPYLYSSLHQSVTSGLPVMRPMVLEFQSDPQTRNLSTQFLLGDSLLVGSATATLTSGSEQPGQNVQSSTATSGKIYLPKGRWYNFWTGQAIESTGDWHTVNWPATVGGPLWVRGGAILPLGQVVSHLDQEPLEVLHLDVYPAGTSTFTAYEDDGHTYDYEKRAFATTKLTATETATGLTLSIGARQGSYKDMPKRRGYLVSVHTPKLPTRVALAGAALPRSPSKDDLTHNPANKGWYYDAQSSTLWIKPTAGWRYDYDSRGAAQDVDRDTVYWDASAPAGAPAMEMAITLVTPPPAPKPVFGTATAVVVSTEDKALIADGTSSTAVTIHVLDAQKRTVLSTNPLVHIEASGGAKLGCGAIVCDVQAINGVASTTLISSLKTGPVTLRATAPGLPTGETTVEMARGQLRLQASPPERVKLNSDGAWLPLRFNLYATIQLNGVTVKSANTRLHLTITGGAGKYPAVKDVPAARGVAVFSNVVLEKPPKYVLKVSGDGLETAEIPIY